MFSCEFYEISKNTFFYRTPRVAASENGTGNFSFVPFRLVQFMEFKTLRAQFSVSFRPPPNSFNITENVETKILMLHNKSC